MDIDGSWNVTIHTPMGAQDAVVTFVNEGGVLTGTHAGNGETLAIDDGRFSGTEASWKVSVSRPMPLTIKFTGELAGDTLDGKAKAGMFPASKFTGIRQ